MLKRLRFNKLLFFLTVFFTIIEVPFRMPLVYGQELLLITRKIDGEPLADVLKQLSKEFGYYIAYDEDKLKSLKVETDLTNLNFESAIAAVLKDFKLTYQIIDEKYVIVKDALVIPSAATSKTLKGSVVDAETGEVLAFALITDLSSYKGGLSNEKGQFSIPLTSETDSLKISFLGYEAQTIFKKDYENQIGVGEVKIKLQKHTETLQTLDVKRQKALSTEVIGTEQSAMLVSNTVASTLSTSQSNNLSYALQFLPGVSAQGGMSSALQVRGGSSDQNLTLVDGFPLYQIGHYNNMFDLVNPVLGDSVKVLKGGYDARYGNRISSIVDVRLDIPSMTQFKAEIGIQSLAVEGMISVPIIEGKLSFLWAGRKSHNLLPKTIYKDLYANLESNTLYTENYSTSDNSESFRQTTFPNVNFYDTNFKLAYLVNDNNSIVLSTLLSEDKIHQMHSFSQNIPNTVNPNRLRNATIGSTDNRTWNNAGASLEWVKIHNENAETKTYLTYGTSALNTDRYFQYDIKSANQNTLIERDSLIHEHEEIKDIGFHIEHKQQTSFGLLELGGDWTHNSIDRISPKEQPTTLLLSSNILGGYAQFSANYQNLYYKFGGRIWYYEPTQKVYVAPRASLHYQLNEAVSLKFALGRYYQFIHQIGDPLSRNSQWFLVDGKGIPAQISDHYISGLTLKQGKSTWDIEVYRKNSKGEISELTLRNPQYREGLKGDGISKGIDTFYEYKQNSWTFYTSYAFNKFTAFFPNEREERKESHIIQLAGMYQLNRFKLGFTWLWNHTNYDFLGFSKKQTDKFPLLEIVQEPFNVPLYHRLDFSAQYNFKLNQKLDAELGLIIYDLYHKQNLQETQITGFKYNSKTQYVLTDLYQTGFLPNLTFKVYF